MSSEHILYLTSTGNLDIFPDNNASNFVNRLSTPIVLDSNTEYEVGLVSILYPDRYYGILAGRESFTITLYTRQENIGITTLKVPYHRHILAGDIEKMVKISNTYLTTYLKSYYGDRYKNIFGTKKILEWDGDEKKVQINCSSRISPKTNIGDIKDINIQFTNDLANIFGFHGHSNYEIYNRRGETQIHKSPKTPSPRCRVDYIYLYTDIVQPSHFGGQLVNILDCFSLQNGGNRGIHNSIYKPLNTHFLDQISIMVRDQISRPISFIEDSTLTCVLHIRPK